tara:strand:+ start:348 stop:1523 length:1176 start_codon:yes stop_codon:yes gene_type:complete
MPSFHSGHFRIFWDILFEAADKYDANLPDKEIVIVSPWISDVTTAQSGWSDTSLASAFGIDSGNLESLSYILGELVRRGFEVKVVTLSTVGKWLPKAVNKHLDNERRFMNHIRDNGVQCFLRNNLHMKYVKTPFAIFCGSVNISFNGLSGRNQETASLFYKDVQDQEYEQRKDAINEVIVGARDYFSNRIPITNYIPPSFAINVGSQQVQVNYQGGIINPTYPELGDDYTSDVAGGFIPQGRIDGTLDTEEKQLSFKAQLAGLTIRVAMRSIEVFGDETSDGYTYETLVSQVFINQVGIDDPAAVEELPSIERIRELLLPAEPEDQLYIREKLGLTDDDDVWDEWRDNARSLCTNLEYLSSKVEDDIASITVADISMLAEMTIEFDSENLI